MLYIYHHSCFKFDGLNLGCSTGDLYVSTQSVHMNAKAGHRSFHHYGPSELFTSSIVR
jgi:hypothetical protein